MYKEIKFTLFDFILEKTDNWEEALVEEVVLVDGPVNDKFYGNSTHYESLYYKAASDTTKELFYLLCDKISPSDGLPHHINNCMLLRAINVELYIDPEHPVDLKNSFLICAKIKHHSNKLASKFEKPIYVGGNVWSMVVDMFKSICNGTYKDICWGCSTDRMVYKNEIHISGNCTQDTVKIYLDNSRWLTDQIYRCDELKGW